ncbi:Golgi apparatus protein 1-like [Littorina saxatilis]|uniref:Golgi apparatus protein 1 n=1 Tax=Littorina saxatilis TaxID=31220 RepID=A0AAN9C180_9CAEN
MAACRRRVAYFLIVIVLLVHIALNRGETNIDDQSLAEEKLYRVKRAAVERPNENVVNKFGAGGVNQNGLPPQNQNQQQFRNLPEKPLVNNNPQFAKNQAGGFRQAVGNGNFNQKPAIVDPANIHNPGGDVVNNLGKIPNKPLQPSKIKISTSPECAADVQKFCSKGVKDNNFSILDCLQSDERTNNEVSETCQNFLWNYKQQLTKDDRFDTASNEVCAKELRKIRECRELPSGQGLIIPCLIEHSENITSRPCQNFLNKMASIIFADYRFIYHFAEKCQSDITKFECGRLHNENDDSPHTQGRTVECLAQHTNKLTEECKTQVLRVYELEADDYHMDRPLYYACHDDRENLCAEVKAGNGAVFQCLFDHLGTTDLSHNCREKLELRQRLMAEDVRVEHSFYSRCRMDIEKHSCLGGTTGHEDAKRANVLMCLESAHMDGQAVDASCVQEMIKVRQRLIEDYRINPDLMARCANEIENHCSGLEPGGKTLHCLMKLARDHSNQRSHISDECKGQLKRLLREANVAEDYRLDKPLQLACGDVVSAVCSHIRPGNGAIISCLMDNLDEDDMTDECEERLLEIQYFVARDFRLDPDLYKSCKRDAKKLCHESGNWADPESMTPDQGPQVLACLRRHFFHPEQFDAETPQVSRVCVFAVKRVMRQRARSVDLNPIIEDACMVELGDLCSEKEHTEKGGELECLQLHYDTLSSNCQSAIANFTEEESEDIHMDAILMKSCTPMIKKFCEDELDNEAEPDEVLECLIEHKNHGEMRAKCAAGIEHHQLISLKDFRFNHKFKEACHKSVQKFCKGKITKYDVVSCLSEHVRNDTLLEKAHRVEVTCRKQLKAELLQRGENIKLDPELEKSCSDDVESYCKNVSPGNANVLECLKKNKQQLSKPCHKMLFKREKDEFAIADYALVHSCKKMIRKHCDTSGSEPEILDCLKKAKDGEGFDDKCRRIVIQRQITQAKDYRLNPLLQKACQQDIPKFCTDVMVGERNDGMLEGKVINCLKKQFAVKRLSQACEHQVRQRVKAASLDIRQAPILMKECQSEIKRHCSDKMLFEKGQGDVESMKIQELGEGNVIECLKAKFREHKIDNPRCRLEIANLLAESHIDVNVDPVLHTACQQDLLSLCRNVDLGQGRHMSCLLSFLDEDPNAMTAHCRDLLKKRKEMWEYAAQVAPPESFGEIYDSIVTSPAKHYFLAVLFTVIGIIFIVGISCGRVTKRVRAELLRLVPV